MNILILTYQGDQAGSTKSMTYLSTRLASRGHRVFFGCRRDSAIFDALRQSDVIAVPMEFSRFGGPAVRDIADICRWDNIDIINAQSSQDRYAAMRARLFHGIRSRIVFTRRQMPNSSRLSSLISTAGAHRIIAVSDAVAQALNRRWIPRSRLEVVHNGIPTGLVDYVTDSEVAALRERLEIPEGVPVIGCIARKKLQDVLIKACPLLPPEAVILLVGSGDLQEWRDLIDEYNVTQRIIMLDYQEDILPFYRLLTVSVLPSMIEGCSQTLLESMSSGVPVVASRWGGNPEVIDDGESGYLFSPTDHKELSDKINRLLDDRALWASFSYRGRQRVRETFDIERTVQRTENCFIRLLDPEHNWTVPQREFEMTPSGDSGLDTFDSGEQLLDEVVKNSN